MAKITNKTFKTIPGQALTPNSKHWLGRAYFIIREMKRLKEELVKRIQ